MCRTINTGRQEAVNRKGFQMNESKRTPGRWIRLTGGILTTSPLADHSSPDKLIGIWQVEPSEANQAHLIKCVNAHDAMLEALKIIHAYQGTPGHSRSDAEYIIAVAKDALKTVEGGKQ